MCLTKQKPIEISSGRGTERQASSQSRALLRLESCPPKTIGLCHHPQCSEHRLVWKWGLPRGHQVKMRSSGWALTQCDWDPYEKGKVRHKGRRARRRRGEETGRRLCGVRGREWSASEPPGAQTEHKTDPPLQVLEGTQPAHILISDFQPPEL